MRLDMDKIIGDIKEERPNRFIVDKIKVNLDKVTPDIQEDRDKVINLLEIRASEQLDSETTVIEDNSIDELYSYTIIHNCGTKPLFDAKINEYYCPACPNSVFDY